MNLLPVNEFLRTKRTDTLFILGCGPSINELTQSQLDRIQSCDTIAFNWFCLGDFPVRPRYYILDAQGYRKTERKSTNLTTETLFRTLDAQYVIIISKAGTHRDGYEKHLERLENDGIILNPAKGSDIANEGINHFLKSMYYGIYHGVSALFYAMHIAIWMNYRNVVFLGVDLYDQSYFFDKGEQWDFLTAENLRREDPHPHCYEILKTVAVVKSITLEMHWYSGSERSMLNLHLPQYW